MNTYIIDFKVCENIFGEAHHGKLLAQADTLEEAKKIVENHVKEYSFQYFNNPEYICNGGYQTN